MHAVRSSGTEPTGNVGGLKRPNVAPDTHLPGNETECADRDERETDRAELRRFVGLVPVAHLGVAREEQIAS